MHSGGNGRHRSEKQTLTFFIFDFGVSLECFSEVSLTVEDFHSHFQANKNTKEMSIWLYLCLFAASIPYFITFLQMGIKILFGSHTWPSFWVLVWVSKDAG